MIKFRCSKCNQKIGANEDAIGRSLRCPKCHHVNTIPDARSESTDVGPGETDPLQDMLHALSDEQISTEASKSTLNYSIKKTILGQQKVNYSCPQCSEDLESALRDAGNQDECPHCGTAFIVPGVSEKNIEAQQRINDQIHRKRSHEKSTGVADTIDVDDADNSVLPRSRFERLDFEGQYTPQIKLLKGERILSTVEAGLLDLGVIGWVFRYKLRLIVTSMRIFRFEKKIIDNRLDIIWLARITSISVGQIINGRQMLFGLLLLLASPFLGTTVFQFLNDLDGSSGKVQGLMTFIIFAGSAILIILMARRKMLVANAGYDKTEIRLTRLATQETQRFANSVFEALSEYEQDHGR